MSIPLTTTTLFKKSPTGRILQWSAELCSDNEFITRYGELGGKIVEKRTIVEQAKGKKTMREQTQQEMNRKIKNKMEKELYTVENPAESATTNNTPVEPLPTDIRPMLAQPFSFDLYSPASKSRAYKIPFPAFAQPKLDGVRCLAFMDKTSGEVNLMSRKGKLFYNFNHIRDAIKDLRMDKDDGIILDGELYSTELTFEKISGIVRSKSITSVEEEAVMSKIKFFVYDVVDKLDFKTRNSFLGYIFEPDNCLNRDRRATDTSLCLVETTRIRSIAELLKKHAENVKNGYEGTMIRCSDGEYEVGKRSKYLQKYKDFMEEEFEIIGYDHEDSKVIWKCKTNDKKNPREFNVVPKATFEERRQLFECASQFVGKQLTVCFQEYTELGEPRFPIGKGIRDYEE